KQVDAITVDLFPGGRAVLYPPDYGCEVEVRWSVETTNDDGTTLTQVIVEESLDIHYAGPTIQAAFTDPQVPVVNYYAAWQLALHVQPETAWQDPDPPKPAAGRPLSVGFYQQLNAQYDALVRDGVRAPIRVLAQKYGARESTVRSWRHRAKQFR